jgi:hypothetical protein
MRDEPAQVVDALAAALRTHRRSAQRAANALA